MEYIKCKFSLHVLLNKSLRFSLFSVRNLIILFLIRNLFSQRDTSSLQGHVLRHTKCHTKRTQVSNVNLGGLCSV